MPHIELRRRDGSLAGLALVDPDDVALVAQYRWHVDGDGYAVAADPAKRGRKLRMHRLLLGLAHGDGLEVDHRNGDRRDNRRSNLRVATRAQNAQNTAARGGASRFRGVTLQADRYRKKPWRARVVTAKKSHHVGYFATEEEAHEAVQAWYARHFPYAEVDRAVA